MNEKKVYVIQIQFSQNLLDTELDRIDKISLKVLFTSNPFLQSARLGQSGQWGINVGILLVMKRSSLFKLYSGSNTVRALAMDLELSLSEMILDL